jgi:hypothetical protein
MSSWWRPVSVFVTHPVDPARHTAANAQIRDTIVVLGFIRAMKSQSHPGNKAMLAAKTAGKVPLIDA